MGALADPQTRGLPAGQIAQQAAGRSDRWTIPSRMYEEELYSQDGEEQSGPRWRSNKAQVSDHPPTRRRN